MFRRYAVAVLVMGLTSWLSAELHPYVGTNILLMSLVGVSVVAHHGGLGPGLVATFLGLVAAGHSYLTWDLQRLVHEPAVNLRMVLFVVLAVTLSLVNDALLQRRQEALARAVEQEALLERERAAKLDAERAYGRARASEERTAHLMERARFLAAASTVLASSLEYGVTLRQVVRLAVPILADCCVVHVLDDWGEGVSRVALAHVDANRERELAALPPHVPLDPQAPHGTFRVLRSGEPELVTTGQAPPAYPAPLPPGFPLTHVGTRSYICVPLLARGRTFGTLTLAYGLSGREYGEEHVALARDLAARAALAIDNARLFGNQKRIAQVLQESLLPPRLPEIPGVTLAACYRAMGAEIEAGGDFYDVLQLAGGTWGLVVGDVVGKGPAAAAVTSLARHNLHAVAAYEDAPGYILSELNRILLREGTPDRYCTMVCVRLEPTASGARAVVARGGHPPPLLLKASGEVEAIEPEGTVVGLFPRFQARERVVDLLPGDALILYTDGVTEARRHGQLYGETRLLDLLAGCRGVDAAGIVARVERDVTEFQEGYLRDDVAVLAVKISTRGT